MSKRPVALLVDDMIEAIEKIESYTSGLSEQSFLKDRKTSDAVVRNLEIIGEAANRLPEDFKQKHSYVEWPKMVGLRHRIVHDYFDVDLQIVWQILKKDLTPFRSHLEKIHATS